MIGGEWKRAGGIDKVPFKFGSVWIALPLASYRDSYYFGPGNDAFPLDFDIHEVRLPI